MKTYDVNYFINYFSGIPEDQWTTHTRMDELGRRCAHGHCNPEITDRYALRFGSERGPMETSLVQIAGVLGLTGFGSLNNGENPNYQQPTPKQRILAALYDIKKMQQIESQPEIKTEYRLVFSDQKVKDLTKEELIMN